MTVILMEIFSNYSHLRPHWFVCSVLLVMLCLLASFQAIILQVAEWTSPHQSGVKSHTLFHKCHQKP